MFGYLWIVVVLVIEAGLLFRFVGEVLEQDISWGEFLAGLAGLVAATALMITHRDDLFGPTVGLSVAAFALLQGAVIKLVNQSLISSMRAADVQEAENLLKTRQDIPYAYRTIGEVLFERGLYGEAIGYLKRALGDDRDPDLEWKLQYCQDEIRRRENKLQVCPRCFQEFPHSVRTCPECDHYLGVRVKGLVGSGAPILGVFLLLCGVGVLVWLAILLSKPAPWLFLVALIPLAVVVAIRRRSLTSFLRRIEKL
jgi:uncharacterized protein (DUF983 family)